MGRREDKQSHTKYIIAEEVNDDKSENAKSNPKVSVFDKLQPSTSCKCLFGLAMFIRRRKDKITKASVFYWLKRDKQHKPFVFTRIKMVEMSSSLPSSQERDSVFSCLGEINKVQSSMPLCIKHVSTLDVKKDDSLRVKTCIPVPTGHGAIVRSKERTKEE